MKKLLTGLTFLVASVFLSVGSASAVDVFAPWYNANTGFNTWVIISNQTGTALNSSNSNSNLQLTAYNTSGNTQGSTSPTIAANGTWIFSLGSVITSTTTTGNTTGNLKLSGTDVASGVSLYVVVEATSGAGFRVPLIGTGYGYTGAY